MDRLALFGLASTALSAGVIASAVVQRRGLFFSICIQLTQHTGNLMVLGSMALYLTIIVGLALQRLFFGHLRTAEIEHLYERSWFSIMDTCLAMTIFREEFGVRFFLLFGVLLFVKTFHWIVADRVDFMDQSPVIPVLFHIRVTSLLMCLGVCDIVSLGFAMKTVLQPGPTMMIIFAFEYAILLTNLCSTTTKYILHTIDISTGTQWDNKSVYFIYIDLIADLTKLIAYTLFFITIIHYYGVPLHVLRDVYVTLRGFVQKCRDLVLYRRATANMFERVGVPTNDELDATDRVCIVCREEMVLPDTVPVPPPVAAPPAPNNFDLRRVFDMVFGQQPLIDSHTPKKLPCGHIFHVKCLRSWLERQQTCPTCRRSVFDQPQGGAAAAAAAAAPAEADADAVRAGLPGGVPPANDPAAQYPGAQYAANQAAAHAAATHQAHHNQTVTMHDQMHQQITQAVQQIIQNQQNRQVHMHHQQHHHHVTGLPVTTVVQSVGGGVSTSTGLPVYVTPIGQIPPGATLTPLTSIPTTIPTIPTTTPPPVPVLDHLTDDQLTVMQGVSRQAIVQQLLALHRVQCQLSGIVTQLTQVLQVMGDVGGDGVDVTQTMGESMGGGSASASASASL